MHIPLFGKSQRLPISKMDATTFAPRHDDELSRRFDEAVNGTCPVYRGYIPMNLIEPFDPNHVFEFIEPQWKIVCAVVNEIRQRNLHPMHVYFKSEVFVMSDDYCKYYAYALEKMTFAHCLIYGSENLSVVDKLRGPLSGEEVKRVLGLGPAA